MRVAYVRVSTKEQNVERQTAAMAAYDIEKVFVEKESGKDTTNRKVFNELMEYVREGDTLYIESISRLGRSLSDLLNIFALLDEKGVKVVSLKESIDTSTANGRMLLGLMGVLSQYERELMLERQKEGIEVAKEKGVKFGRPKKVGKKELAAIQKEIDKGNSVLSVCKEFGISTQTYYRMRDKNEG